MAEQKPLASLSPSLLARKGAARPAMRPQAYINFTSHVEHAAEDLGWNDMGNDMSHETPAPVVAMPGHQLPKAAPVVAPPVVQQQAALAAQLAPSADLSAKIVGRAAPGSRGKAAFTLRLDPERHLHLRLLSALTHKSAQHIVTAALDAALEVQSVALEAAKALNHKG